MNLKLMLLLAGAGAVGTLARYALSSWVNLAAGERFPWGTVAVNLVGCLLFGFVWTACFERRWISAETSMIALTGFMGAFTTFSTFAFDTQKQLAAAQWQNAGMNVVLQVAAGVGLVYLGMAAGRMI